VEFVDYTTQAKTQKKMTRTSSKSTYKTRSIRPKNAKIKENNEIKEIKEGKDKEEDKGKELFIKYCPTNATVSDLLMKPLTRANICKLHRMIKTIIGQ
jgi:hypothetical protein